MSLFKSASILSILCLVLTACAQAVSPTPASLPSPYPLTQPGEIVSPTLAPYLEPPVEAVMPTVAPGAYPNPTGEIPTLAPQQPPSKDRIEDAGSFAPLPGDAQLARGTVFFEADNASLTVSESNPVQVSMHLVGSLPNPCHHLRAKISEPNAQNRVDVEVYTVLSQNMACIEVLKEFDVQIPLGSYTGGKYSVYLNGVLVGEFDA
jgi:hypothetical protein